MLDFNYDKIHETAIDICDGTGFLGTGHGARVGPEPISRLFGFDLY